MSLIDSLHQRNPRRWSRARPLVGAWAILVATSLLSSGCLIPSAVAHDPENVAELAVAGSAGSSAARHAHCCEEMRTGSPGLGAWGPISADPPGSGLLAMTDRGWTAWPAIASAPAHGSRHRAALSARVPPYLLTLRLRA